MAGMLVCSVPSSAAMTISEIRQDARFLSDRMAYELGLTNAQYADIYEINYDFMASIRYIMDGVVNGDDYSIDRYYEFLDMRNEDLSYVLTRQQYLKFANKEYFYRPVYTENNYWRLRVYTVYTDPTYFFLSIPLNFLTYVGGHSRIHYHNSFYNGRYKHELYSGPLCRVRNQQSYPDHRWQDFKVPPRPNQSVSDRSKGTSSKSNVRSYQNNSSSRFSGQGKSQYRSSESDNNRRQDVDKRQNSSSNRPNISTGNRPNQSVGSSKDKSGSTSTVRQSHSSTQKKQPTENARQTNIQSKQSNSKIQSSSKTSSSNASSVKSSTRKESGTTRR